MTFNGFISYSHAADGRLAPAVQRGLHRLAKPWHRRRALWIFRDQTGLSVTPALWSSIQQALDGSDYFVLLASPEAAQSPWVNREIEHWVTTKPADRILPVVTDGEWAWDRSTGDFAADSTAVPDALRGVFHEEPLFLDLRWARGGEHLSLQHSRFRDAIAQLAAPMHGVSKDELEGEDVRQHRRVKRLRSGAVATLAVLLLVAGMTGVSAVKNADQARRAAAEALRQEQVANEQRGSAQFYAEESKRQQQRALEEQKRAADASALAQEQEKLARTQQDLAKLAAAEADRQEKLAARATNRTKEQQRLARQQAERAQALAEEAEKLAEKAEELAKKAEDARKEAEESANEAATQSANAERQQQIAVSRRLLNQAGALIVEDPRTALMLSAAAQAVRPEADTRIGAAGIVASTRWEGSIAGAGSVTYLPDGTLVTVNENGSLSMWSLADPRKPARLATFTNPGPVSLAAVASRDGRMLAVTDSKGTTVLWNIADRRKPARLTTLDVSGARSVAFSPDRRTLAVASSGAPVLLYDITDVREPALLWQSEDGVRQYADDVHFSADGKLLLAHFFTGRKAFDVRDRKNPVEVTGKLNTYGIVEMAVSPTTPVMAGGGSQAGGLYDLSVLLEDSEIDELDDLDRATTRADDDEILTPPPHLPWHGEMQLSELVGLNSRYRALTFSGDGTALAAGDDSGTAMVWDVRDPGVERQLATVKVNGSILSMALSPDGTRLVTTESSGVASIWNVPGTGAPTSRSSMPQSGRGAVAMEFGPDGRSFVTVDSEGAAKTWNVADTGRPQTGTAAPTGSATADFAAVSRDLRTVAVVDEDGALTITDLSDPARPRKLATFDTGMGERTDNVEVSPDGRIVAVLGRSALQLYGLADRNRPALVSKREDDAFRGAELTFTPDGRTLAVAGGNRSAGLWNVTNPAAPALLSMVGGHTGEVSALAFSPDGLTLATGSGTDSLFLWDLTDPRKPQRSGTVADPNRSAGSLAFGPDGRTLAILSGDSSVHVWDVSDRNGPVRLARFENSPSFGGRLRFSPDGRTLAVSSNRDYDGRKAHIELWDYTALNSLRADPARVACRIAGRGLDAGEWKQLVPELPYRRTCAG